MNTTLNQYLKFRYSSIQIIKMALLSYFNIKSRWVEETDFESLVCIWEQLIYIKLKTFY